MSEPKNNSSFKPDWVFWGVVVCLFGLIALAAILNPVRAIISGNGTPCCINNLHQINAAAYQFALENHLTNGDHINFPSDLTNYIKLTSTGKIPPCPSGGIYSIKKVGDVPTCSLGTNVPQAHVLP